MPPTEKPSTSKATTVAKQKENADYETNVEVNTQNPSDVMDKEGDQSALIDQPSTSKKAAVVVAEESVAAKSSVPNANQPLDAISCNTDSESTDSECEREPVRRPIRAKKRTCRYNIFEVRCSVCGKKYQNNDANLMQVYLNEGVVCSLQCILNATK